MIWFACGSDLDPAVNYTPGIHIYSVSQKKIPPYGFLKFFPKPVGNF